VRLFLALDVPADTARNIDHWRAQNLAVDGRAVPLTNLHVTVAFLGEVDERHFEELCEAVGEQLDTYPVPAASLHFDRLGYWQKPGIVWLGVSAPVADDWHRLARRLQQLPGRFGNPVERRDWVPHITLFRGVAGAPPAALTEPELPLRQGRLTLFQSRRGRDGVRYESLGEWQFAG
jgi:2'-5' RNA ligase